MCMLMQTSLHKSGHGPVRPFFFLQWGMGKIQAEKHEKDDYLIEVDSGAGEWKNI